jgi:hypothetical protein
MMGGIKRPLPAVGVAKLSVAVTGANESAAQAPAVARLRSWLDLRSTPGKLRATLIAFVAASLAWGALAAFTVNQYSSAASGVVATGEPLTLDAQHIYQDLSDAEDTEATAFLNGGLEPFALRDRYLADINQAAAAIENAAATGSNSQGIVTLSTGLPRYAGEIETARADNRIGYPLGAAYLREASTLMNGTLLPAADNLYSTENSRLTATSAEATGLPLVIATLAVGLVIGYMLYRTSRWLARRTHRVLNFGLLAAGVAVFVSLAWLAVVFTSARGDLLAAQASGSAPAMALARADIVALQAHADESLTLIDNTGDDSYQADYVVKQKALGPGPGTLLTVAITAAAGSPAAAAARAAAAHAQSWYQAHAALRKKDDGGKHAAAVASALGSGTGDAGGQFAAFSGRLASGISAGQRAFAASASAGENMYTGLEAAVIVLALLMAGGCAWGLSRRLVEYR